MSYDPLEEPLFKMAFRVQDRHLKIMKKIERLDRMILIIDWVGNVIKFALIIYFIWLFLH